MLLRAMSGFQFVLRRPVGAFLYGVHRNASNLGIFFFFSLSLSLSHSLSLGRLLCHALRSQPPCHLRECQGARAGKWHTWFEVPQSRDRKDHASQRSDRILCEFLPEIWSFSPDFEGFASPNDTKLGEKGPIHWRKFKDPVEMAGRKCRFLSRSWSNAS